MAIKSGRVVTCPTSQTVSHSSQECHQVSRKHLMTSTFPSCTSFTLLSVLLSIFELMETRCSTSQVGEMQLFRVEIQENVLACERKIKAAEEEGVEDEKLEALRRELKEELQNEQLLNLELRQIEDEMNRLELQRVNIEKHKKVLKDAMTDDARARSSISLYASITKIIPDLNEKDRDKGYIVDRDRSKMERFEFDQTTMSNVEICNRLWNMGDTIQRH